MKANVTALKTLLFDYVPSLFLLGTLVRDYNSDGGDRNTPKQPLHYYLHILVRLVLGREHLVEYVRSVLTAIVVWCPSMTGLHAWCHTEEMCEAMLSRRIKPSIAWSVNVRTTTHVAHMHGIEIPRESDIFPSPRAFGYTW